jgi:predicted GH43/DUF377 family glycosyl hydrolase
MTADWVDELRTPQKTGRLLLQASYQNGQFDSHAVDCPFPFCLAGAYYMTFVGFDGAGYRTGLARSTDLFHWEKQGLILDRGPAGSLTQYNAAMTCILRDNELFGPGTLKRVNDCFLGTYHAYPAPGYEEGPACIGLCYSRDLLHWELTPPVLRSEEGAEWERGGLYKSWLVEHNGTYYLFYNAKNQTHWPWHEQTGVACSTDLEHWVRHPLSPVLRNGPAGALDDTFASDPVVLRHNGHWLMFYFGLCSDGHARDSVACSDDLLNWTKSGQALIDIGAPGSIDAQHAHKPGMISKDGRLYHFYCAVSPNPARTIGEIEWSELRGITVAHH